MFRRLVERHGWFGEREHADGVVISLRRGHSSITLEPGAQFELSGAPLETVHETCTEFRGHMAELADISEELGLSWLGLGFHPLASADDLPWVPKLRYGVMREYLPTRGSMALDMMRRTATVQANLDFSDEQDAIRKLRLALRASPIVTAMFANSPFVEGRATGERSRRARVWLHMDPDRSGLLPFAWEEHMSYRRYVEWALDVPMFMLKREGRALLNTGQTFRAFLDDGFEGARATMSDWEIHVNTLFPEARLKNTLEVRSADGQSTDMTCALPALWKGLLYDASAMSKAETLLEPLRFEEVQGSREHIADRGLRATLAGREVAEWASELLDAAETGLRHLSNLSSSGDDETVHLARLRERVSRASTPADDLLDRIDAAAPLLPQLLEHAQV